MPEDGDAQDGADGPSEQPVEQAGDTVESGFEPASPQEVEDAVGVPVETQTSVETNDDGDVTVKREWRSAAFAEIADRPKKKALDDEKRKGDVQFYDDLRKFDPELAGTIRAQCQQAADGLDITHPAIFGEKSEMSDIEKKITDSCGELLERLGIKEDAETYFRNTVVHGNDASHFEYTEAEDDQDEGGIVDMNPLPLRLLTIVNEEIKKSGYHSKPETLTVIGENAIEDDFDKIISEADWYVLAEEHDETRQEFPAHDVLHIANNRRDNWRKDRLGRMTYDIWGEKGLEPVKYAVQTKSNTMANKVAMDDKLLQREYFTIKVEELFGHIADPDDRQERVEEYAKELRAKLENLEADQKPILPDEVEVKVEGPDGQTARNQAEFIQTMNDSIQHALTYHVASFGRDAGGTDRGNRPAKEMSENTVRQLRNAVRNAFKQLFEVHAKLAFPDARIEADGEFDDDDHRRYELADGIVLPTLKFAPVDPEDRNDEVRNAATLYEKGIADLNEARAEVNLEPMDESDRDQRMWHPDKNPTTLEEDIEMDEQPNDPDDTDGTRESPNDEPTESRPSRPTNSSLDADCPKCGVTLDLASDRDECPGCGTPVDDMAEQPTGKAGDD